MAAKKLRLIEVLGNAATDKNFGKLIGYSVLEVKNATHPRINQGLTQAEVNELIETVGFDVTISGQIWRDSINGAL